MDWNMEDVTELLFILAINNSPTHLRSSILEKMSKSSNENPEADSFRSKNCSIITYFHSHAFSFHFFTFSCACHVLLLI